MVFERVKTYFEKLMVWTFHVLVFWCVMFGGVVVYIIATGDSLNEGIYCYLGFVAITALYYLLLKAVGLK